MSVLCVRVIAKRTRTRAFATRSCVFVIAFFIFTYIFYLLYIERRKKQHISERHRKNCANQQHEQTIFFFDTLNLKYEPFVSIVFRIFVFHLQMIGILIFIRFLFFCHFDGRVCRCGWMLFVIIIIVWWWFCFFSYLSFFALSPCWLLLLLFCCINASFRSKNIVHYVCCLNDA